MLTGISTLTNKEIYNGILNRDNKTFTYLYKEYKDMITAMVIKNSGNEDDALDIFQEGLTALWTNIKMGKFEIQSNTKISTYLYTLCRNLWISKIRKVKPLYVVDDESTREIADEAYEAEENHERVSTLEKQLKRLGENCQKLLRLFYYEKASMKDIALSMQITEKTAKNNKYRCMQNLKSLYESRA